MRALVRLTATALLLGAIFAYVGIWYYIQRYFYSCIVFYFFFDNQKYFDFVKACRAEGITVPIIPGLKVIKSEAQLRSLPKSFYIDLPDELVDQVTKNPKHAVEIGRTWAKRQSMGLLEAGVPTLHYYVLNDVDTIAGLVKEIRK